jgi:hypothetical protein
VVQCCQPGWCSGHPHLHGTQCSAHLYTSNMWPWGQCGSDWKSVSDWWTDGLSCCKRHASEDTSKVQIKISAKTCSFHWVKTPCNSTKAHCFEWHQGECVAKTLYIQYSCATGDTAKPLQLPWNSFTGSG